MHRLETANQGQPAVTGGPGLRRRPTLLNLVAEPLLLLYVCCLLLQAIQGGLEGIRRLEQRHISVAEAKAAAEVFLIGSSLPIMPVVQVGGVGRAWGAATSVDHRCCWAPAACCHGPARDASRVRQPCAPTCCSGQLTAVCPATLPASRPPLCSGTRRRLATALWAWARCRCGSCWWTT